MFLKSFQRHTTSRVVATTSNNAQNWLWSRMSSTATAKAQGPVEQAIITKLKTRFAPLHLEVVNESYKHAVPKGSETHFKVRQTSDLLLLFPWPHHIFNQVVVVSEEFEGKSLIDQHRLVNELLRDELANGVHALSIKTMNPTKWRAAGNITHETPNCMGGSKHG